MAPRTPRALGLGLLLACGTIALVPTTSEAQTRATWESTFDAAWARANKYYAIKAASTVAGDAACQGDLAFNVRIKELTRAIAAHKYGDATRLLGAIQDKSLCLTLEGTRGLEFALAGWVHRSVNELSGAELDTAVFGALNVGALVFDELQYTKRSYWMPTMKFHADKLAPIVARYPKADLPFVAFNWSKGTLDGRIDPGLLLASMRNFANYGDGSCTLLDMSAASYACRGWVGKNGMGGGGGAGGGGGGATGGLPGMPSTTSAASSAVSCIVDATTSSGARGSLGCAAKAVAGMTFDPRTATATSLMSTGVAGGQPGVRDPRCALSADAGNGGPQQDAEAKKKEPTTWERIKDAAGAVKDYTINVFMAVFDKTPPGISELGQAASPEGADAARGIGQVLQAQDARGALFNDDAAEGYEKKRDNRVVTDPQANQGRTAPDIGGGPLGHAGGGGCSRGSNAARRANALYDCISGGGPKPTNRGPNNPLVAMTDPGQVQTTPTGALACMQQGGDMPRTSFSDPKCANTRCVQGALSCPCDRSGGGIAGLGAPIPRLSATSSPNCAEPPCGSLVPKSGGVVTGGPTGPSGPPTVGSGGPAPFPPPR